MIFPSRLISNKFEAVISSYLNPNLLIKKVFLSEDVLTVI